MLDVDKQIEFWQLGAQEDWVVAKELVDRGRVRHGLFFGHLALEKLLKAHVCKQTRDLAPKIHNLVRLAETARLELCPEYLDLIAEMNAFNIEGRYPESLTPPPSVREAEGYVRRAQEVFEWLMNLL